MKITKENLKDLELWLHPDQKNGYVRGHEVLSYLKDHNLLEECLDMEDLEEIQKLGIEEFRKYFEYKWVYAWKGVQGDGVPYLCENGDEVVLHWHHLDDGWFAYGPGLRRKSVLETKKLSSSPKSTLPLYLNSLEKRIERLEQRLDEATINI